MVQAKFDLARYGGVCIILPPDDWAGRKRGGDLAPRNFLLGRIKKLYNKETKSWMKRRKARSNIRGNL